MIFTGQQDFFLPFSILLLPYCEYIKLWKEFNIFKIEHFLLKLWHVL